MSGRTRLMGETSASGVEALGWATLIRSIGSGGMLTLAVLYFATFRDIPAGQVGLALTIGGLAGVAASVPLGHAANGARSRDASAAAIMAQGAVTFGFLAVNGFPALVVVACMAAVAEAGSNGARGTLIANLVRGPERVVVRARLRAITNAGSAVGAGLGGLVLSVDTAALWNAAVVVCALCLLTGGSLIFLVPKPPGVSVPPEARRWQVFTDGRYALLAALNVVLTMNLGLLTVALPIWIAQDVDAPAGVFGGLIILNTVLVVAFQVRATKGVDGILPGGRAMRNAGFALGLCCLFFATAGGLSPLLALAVLVIGGVVHALGEMWHAAGSWELSYRLAPEHAHGQYQGMFTMSSQLGGAIAPVLTVSLVAGLGAMGWVALAGLMAVTGLASGMMATHTARRTPAV